MPVRRFVSPGAFLRYRRSGHDCRRVARQAEQAMDLGRGLADRREGLDIRTGPALRDPVGPARQALPVEIDRDVTCRELIGEEPALGVASEIGHCGLEPPGVGDKLAPFGNVLGAWSEIREEGVDL